jgi:branched-chain amino acid transport system substrate-binding protein
MAVAGCASSGSGIEPGETLKVYVSMPLRGQQAPGGRDVVDGARMALADADGRVGELRIRAVYMDDTAGRGDRARWSPAAAAANARRASEDSAAIAYIGDFESGATRFSLPITNEAHILQVSPASAAVDLAQPFLGAGDQVPEEVQPTGERTFGRVIPSDEMQAEAGAVWAKQLGVRDATVGREDSGFGRTLAAAFTEEARAIGVRAGGARDIDLFAPIRRTRRVVCLASLLTFPFLYYAGSRVPTGLVASPCPNIRYEHGVMASDALNGSDRLKPLERLPLRLTAAAQDPDQLPPRGKRFVRGFGQRYGREPGPYTAYGYEAMAVVLDSIARAGESGDDRDAVVDAFLETTDRESILGTYSIDEAGNTTLNRLSGYRVENGRPVFATPLTVPR